MSWFVKGREKRGEKKKLHFDGGGGGGRTHVVWLIN